MMQQMMSNPQLSQSLLQSPYMQSTLQAMASNPEMARQVCSSCMILVHMKATKYVRMYFSYCVVKFAHSTSKVIVTSVQM